MFCFQATNFTDERYSHNVDDEAEAEAEADDDDDDDDSRCIRTKPCCYFVTAIVTATVTVTATATATATASVKVCEAHVQMLPESYKCMLLNL
uniref:Uncharacterized protein n=1 Tax=Syphacia muris TaxID=451379 RepID=A0A0N5AU63_9BILA